MREILFRGKRIDNGEWAEGHLCNIGILGTTHLAIVPYEVSIDYDRIAGYYIVDPATVGQYTGLADKSGKKIFEGDICRNTKTGEIVSVKWHGTFAGYVWSKRKENNKHLHDFGELFRVYDKYEVIGNIHDNPELLKEEK